MQVVSKIQFAAESLTPSELRLVKSVVESPREAALGKAGDLARDAGVHEATVSRLVRKLGFDNFASFRRALQADFIPAKETAKRLEKSLDAASQSSPLLHLLRQEIEALDAVALHVRSEQIESCAKRLMKARRIFIFGRGNSEALAIMMLRRLRRFGLVVQQLSGDPRDLAEQIIGISKEDLVLAFAFGRTPKGYRSLISFAHKAGAHTIAISDSSGPLQVPQPKMLLAAPRAGQTDTYQSLNVPMTICNAIILTAAAVHKSSTLKTLDQLGALIEAFENEAVERQAPQYMGVRKS